MEADEGGREWKGREPPRHMNADETSNDARPVIPLRSIS